MSSSRFVKTMFMWPLSRLYGMGVAIRNMFFDRGLLSQKSFDIPVVAVGNIAVGGTGKTPHTEYIVDSLRYEYRIGILSRGYRRRTRGFVLATNESHPDDIGDEPYQLYRHFNGSIMVAVCEDRVKGIEQMRRIDPGLQMIVLDDAFQHRYVKPTVAIVLSEYNRLPFNDKLMPLGRLREPLRALDRADAVVITKCPDSAQPIDYRMIREHLNLFPYQKLIFSHYKYKELQPVFPDAVSSVPDFSDYGKTDIVVSLTGVANPRPFLRYLRSSGAKVKVIRFNDHHRFTASDMQLLSKKYATVASNPRAIIITTEKDAVRIASCPYFPADLRDKIFYIPIAVEVLPHSDIQIPDLIRQTIRANL